MKKRILALAVILLTLLLPAAASAKSLPDYAKVCDEHKCPSARNNGYHVWTEYDINYEPTCTEAGGMLMECVLCGKQALDYYEPAFGHDWCEEQITREATCTKAGEMRRICAHCGIEDVSEIKKKPHTWGEWTVLREPDDFSAGLREHTCSVCEKTVQEDLYPDGTLKKGDKGDAVMSLQNSLNAAGFDCGAADGVYGKGTAEAVSALEEAHGMTGDGIAWPGVQLWLMSHPVLRNNPPAQKTLSEEDTCRRGDKDMLSVWFVQQMLKDEGYLTDKVDGNFGKNTENALKKFQSAKGLPADGIADEQTLLALYRSFLQRTDFGTNSGDGILQSKVWASGMTAAAQLSPEAYDSLGSGTHRVTYLLTGTVFTKGTQSLAFENDPAWEQVTGTVTEDCSPDDWNTCVYCGWHEKTVDVFFYENFSDGQRYFRYTDKDGYLGADILLPERNGFLFGGWYYDEACTLPFSQTDQFAEDTTLFAAWIPVYTVTFYTEEGRVFGTALTGADGKLSSLLAYWCAADRTFLGWSTLVYGGSPIDADYVFTQDTALYAQVAAQWTVTFALPDGSTVSAQTDRNGHLTASDFPSSICGSYLITGWHASEADRLLTDTPDSFTASATVYRDILLQADTTVIADISAVALGQLPQIVPGARISGICDALSNVPLSAAGPCRITRASLVAPNSKGYWSECREGLVQSNVLYYVSFVVEADAPYRFAETVTAIADNAMAECERVSDTKLLVYVYYLNGKRVSKGELGSSRQISYLYLDMDNFSLQNGSTFTTVRNAAEGKLKKLSKCALPVCANVGFETAYCQWYIRDEGDTVYALLPYGKNTVDTQKIYRLSVIVRADSLREDIGYLGVLTFDGGMRVSAVGSKRSGNFMSLGNGEYLLFNFILNETLYDMDAVRGLVANMDDTASPMDDPQIVQALNYWLTEQGIDPLLIPAIVDTLAGAEPQYQQLYLLTAGRYEISEIDPELSNSGSNWSSTDKILEMEPVNTYEDTQDYLTTFFHETGHGIDDLSREDAETDNSTYHLFTRDKYREELFGAMTDDLSSYLRGKMDSGTSANEEAAILTAVIGSDYRTEKGPVYDDPDFDEPLLSNYKQVRTKGTKGLNSIYRSTDARIATDVGAGMTNLTLRTIRGHFGSTYWYNSSGSPTYKQNSEAWAHYYSAKVRNADAWLEADAEAFPGAIALMDEIADEMLKQLKEQEAGK